MSESANEKHAFQAEVSRLLHMMINSVYSEREIFLRELISNASDACDKLRYLAITEPSLQSGGDSFRIDITLDRQARLITIADNGVGMSHDELIENLGTIAHSGTGKFVDQLTGDASADIDLIGQFGVGFYSAFMVAEHVDVLSRRAGSEEAWAWQSGGTGEFEMSAAQKPAPGTEIRLHIRTGEDEFLDPARLRQVISAYSDHVAHPIYLHIAGEADAESEEKPVNSGSALWTRPKSEITEEQYKEFYHTVGHMFDDPWLTIHYRAEGKIEFTVLLFIPSMPPMDLFDPARQNRLRLYVRRVFITEEAQLLPPWLRFVRGVVDSADMPLNISREMLQNNPMVTRIRKALTNRILTELKKKAEKDPEGFTQFWRNFGAVIKEGLYEDAERGEDLLKLARFATSKSGDALRSLDDYLSAMPDTQTAIYYIAGESEAAIKRSPQLEGFVARDIEVLLLSDPVDDFWLTMHRMYDGKPFKSITQGDADLKDLPPKSESSDTPDTQDAVPEGEMAILIALCKQALGEAVSDVRASHRLTESAVCLVASEAGIDMNLERILARQNQDGGLPKTARILELNPSHPMIRALAGKAKAGGAASQLEEAAHLLLDQARILEGEPLPDPASFAKRMAAMVTQAIGSAS